MPPYVLKEGYATESSLFTDVHPIVNVRQTSSRSEH